MAGRPTSDTFGGVGPLGRGSEGRTAVEGAAGESQGLAGAIATAFRGVFFEDKSARRRGNKANKAHASVGDGDGTGNGGGRTGASAPSPEVATAPAPPTPLLEGGFRGLWSRMAERLAARASPDDKDPESESGTREADEKDPRTLAAREGATLRRMADFAWPERHRIAVAVSTLSVTTCISLTFPWALGKILDVSLAPDPTFTPGTIAAGMTALFGVQVALIIVRSAMLSVAGERIAATVRTQTFKALVA